MNTTVRQRVGASLLVIAAAMLSTGCASEAPVGPDSTREAEPVAASASAPHRQGRAPDLGACQNLKAPEGTRIASRLYAMGVQIYHWDGASWIFDAPSAVLSADPRGRGIVGTHYAGPTWASRSGGTVVGSVVDRCTPDPTAIPWLLLATVSDGPGLFHGVTAIQRVETVGGNAPPEPGSVVGQQARVPYSAVYVFYRGR